MTLELAHTMRPAQPTAAHLRILSDDLKRQRSLRTAQIDDQPLIEPHASGTSSHVQGLRGCSSVHPPRGLMVTGRPSVRLLSAQRPRVPRSADLGGLREIRGSRRGSHGARTRSS